ARILSATSPGSGDPDTAGEDLAFFVAAIGPVWSPPTEFATEPAPTEDARTFVEAAETVSRAVFESASDLGSGLIPVLSDVAMGLTLVAGDDELIDTADELIRASREEAPTPPPRRPAKATRQTRAGTTPRAKRTSRRC